MQDHWYDPSSHCYLPVLQIHISREFVVLGPYFCVKFNFKTLKQDNSKKYKLSINYIIQCAIDVLSTFTQMHH